MSKRVSPAERIRGQIDQLFSSDRDLAEVLEEVGQLGVRLLMQTSIEMEMTEFLGRERYSRKEGVREGFRNGYCPVTVKTTAGPVEIARPKLRGTSQAFISRLFGKGVTRTNALESLVIAGYVRGLSTRDVEAALADALGEQAALSRSTVSRICSAIKDEFDAWKQRDLSEMELEYLYLDACHFRYHQGARSEPVMCARGITADGKPVFLSLAAVSAESHDAVVDFLRDMVARGLRTPVLVITDGAAGLISAVEQVYEQALRQRCLIHRARNVLSKVSKGDQDEVKADYWSIFDNIEQAEGEQAIAEANRRAARFADKWRAAYPSAVACAIDDWPALTVHLRFPAGHWSRIRHSNLIERTFGEAKRRPRSSAGCPASIPACRWCGRCWTEPPEDGEASPKRQLMPGSFRHSAGTWKSASIARRWSRRKRSYPPRKLSSVEPASVGFYTRDETSPRPGSQARSEHRRAERAGQAAS